MVLVEMSTISPTTARASGRSLRRRRGRLPRLPRLRRAARRRGRHAGDLGRRGGGGAGPGPARPRGHRSARPHPPLRRRGGRAGRQAGEQLPRRRQRRRQRRGPRPAREAGVDPALVVEAVSDGTGANWQLANLFPRKVLQGDFEPGFRITHMAKDLRIAAEVAGELGLDLPELALARARADEARARFGDDRDYGAVARLNGWGTRGRWTHDQGRSPTRRTACLVRSVSPGLSWGPRSWRAPGSCGGGLRRGDDPS